MSAHHFEELTSEYLHTIAPKTLVIIPIGAVEQHGPHLPVGCDSFNVKHMAIKAAEKTQNKLILVAPTLWYGSSHHHLKYSGTMSLRGQTLLAVLCDLGNSLAAGGFKKLFFLSGHGGNSSIIREAARELVNEHHQDLIIGAASYWEITRTALSQKDVPKQPYHSGIFETSLQLALDETLVDTAAKQSFENGTYSTSQYRAFNEQEKNTLRFQALKGRAAFQRPDSYRKCGVSELPVNASRKLGQKLFEVMIEELATFFSDFLKHP